MSEENQSGSDDRQHLPTPQKIQRSREKGDVPYSMEVTTAATYGALFILIVVAGGWSAMETAVILSALFHRPADVGAALLTPESTGFLESFIMRLAVALGPVFLVLAGAAALSVLVQRAFVFAPSKLKPKLSRLSIIDNAKQKYGPQGIFEFAKSAVKLTAIIAILVFGLRDRFFSLPELTSLPAAAFPSVMRREAVFFLGLVAFAAVVVAAIDLPWRRFQHQKKLMMTHEELRKESKETEGDPHLKGARRERASAIARNRMLADVPNADIVIVNPMHYAVALSWDREAGAAPVCVAKGVDGIAARIREVASASGVPIRRDPPTARSIYATVEIGQEIRKEHYAAVAAAIHYADEIAKRARQGYVQ
ncbi:MAG: flagellar biosynthesis protein FlhB [Rhodomicrobium sp.]|nr:flagellar biosynthesis protein FlhB [Rhodomicrobium sp.]